MPNPQPTGIVALLLAAVHRLHKAVGRVVQADLRIGPAAIAWLWLVTASENLARLIARIEAGSLKPSRPRSAAAAPGLPGAGLRLPRANGWLLRELPDIAPFGSEIEALLANPGLQPLLAQQPTRFGRILNPLCRALGLTPPETLRASPPPAVEPSAAAPPPVTPAPAALARVAPRPGVSVLDFLRLAPKNTAPTRRDLALGGFPLTEKIA